MAEVILLTADDGTHVAVTPAVPTTVVVTPAIPTTVVVSGALKGETGPPGVQGPIGPTGLTGSVGIAGPIGPIGPAGAQGPSGTAGTNGTDGATGPAGPTGSAGAAATIAAGTATGLSYGVSPTVTNTGSSSAATFNFGIPAGATGATGPTGSTGPTGATGATGAAGTNGTNGIVTSLTTTGTSGAATVASGVLNIPQYSGGGGGITRSTNAISGAITGGSTALTDYTYIWNGSTAYTFTLPTAVSNTNVYSMVNSSLVNQTFATTSSQTVNGSTTGIIIPGQTLDVISDNSNWQIT